MECVCTSVDEPAAKAMAASSPLQSVYRAEAHPPACGGSFVFDLESGGKVVRHTVTAGVQLAVSPSTGGVT